MNLNDASHNLCDKCMDDPCKCPMDRNEIIRLLKVNAYNAYAASLNGLKSSRFEEFKDPKVGDIVIETSTVYGDDPLLRGIGILKEIEVKKYEHEDSPGDFWEEKYWHLELLTDGSMFRWHNAEFIKVQNNVWRDNDRPIKSKD